jgi:circadian clock protein KaiC
VFTESDVYDLFSAQEVEREPTTKRIVEAIERLAPTRVFVDSMTSLRFLTTDTFQFRRQALSFLRFLAGHNATVLVTSETTTETPDDDLRFLVDGVIEVAMEPRTWSLAVKKFRGSAFRSGRHGMRLGASGAEVFPRLLPEDHNTPVLVEQFSLGIGALDEMVGGGIEKGTITLLSGPTGVGKSTLAITALAAVASTGVRAVMYTFDERPETILRRCEGLGIDVHTYIEAGTLAVRGIEALRFGSDEFATTVRRDIEENGTGAIAIDSISGYRMTIEGTDLVERLHALGRYLQNIGVTVFLVDELRDLTDFRASDAGISYLADNAIFLRYVEHRNGDGLTLRKAIGVLKKRLSDFDKSLREFTITAGGLQVGESIPLRSLFTPMMALESSTE